ncbi:hypothetical protein B0H14DRAFT_3642863 [Mycena olivaceomarginata]|nr:hypothetical protein B0H14DRAFT_3642863 [Mycena olivaceomarginata]
MARSATFCEIPVSTSLDPLSANSLVSLDWILSSGIPARQSVASGVLTIPSTDTVYSMHLKVSVAADLSCDLVLGRDWLFFCRQTLPHASFELSSGIVRPGQLPRSSPADSASESCAMNIVPHLADDNVLSPQCTLVLVTVSLVTYIITGQSTGNGAPKPDRKVYHMIVDQLKILDHRDGKPWNPPIPSLPDRRYSPMTPKRPRDAAADAAFNSFGTRSSPSPPKRSRRTAGTGRT